jgi:hypothetical protein
MSYGMFKAGAIAAELADVLAKRLSSMVVTQGVDSGYPTITISQDATPAAGEKVIFIKVNQLTWSSALNSIGNTQDIYDKVVIQMVTEKNYEGTTDSVTDILGPAELLPVLGLVLKKGTRVEWYRTNNGTVPSASGITGVPAASWDPEFYFPAVGF